MVLGWRNPRVPHYLSASWIVQYVILACHRRRCRRRRRRLPVSSVGIRLSAARRARQWFADVTSLTLTDTDGSCRRHREFPITFY